MELMATDNVTNLLQSYLDVQSLRSQVIAENIANADTPGYVAKKVEFSDFLNDAARQSSLPASQQYRNGSISGPQVVEQESIAIGLDGNTVDAGREMAEMAQAGSSFNFGAKMLQSRLRLLRTAIREGK
jgi:flagellar basal-body rod protein FlgB